MRRPTSGRRAGFLQPGQLVIGFAVVIVLIGVAIAVIRSRAQTDLGGISGADPTNAALVSAGRQVYDTRCASCHGADLEASPTGSSHGRMAC